VLTNVPKITCVLSPGEKLERAWYVATWMWEDRMEDPRKEIEKEDVRVANVMAPLTWHTRQVAARIRSSGLHLSVST